MVAQQIPDITGLSRCEAALAYADAGIYVVPTDPKVNIKHPGSVLGKNWPELSSRSAGDILAWFDPDYGGNPDYGIALHMGRSGLVAFDVDKPDNLPAWLNQALMESRSPLHCTRREDFATHPRGHRVFRLPENSTLGNSTKNLVDEAKGPWGEVRGTNGVIIVAPTPHPDPTNGWYRWVRTGTIAPLPPAIAQKMRTGTQAAELAPQEVVRWLDGLPGGEATKQVRQALSDALAALAVASQAGNGRHDACNDAQMVLVNYGAMGMGGVKDALAALKTIWDRVAPGREDEWMRGLLGAVAKVTTNPPDAPTPDGGLVHSSVREGWNQDKIGKPRDGQRIADPLKAQVEQHTEDRSLHSLDLASSEWFEQQVQREYWLAKARDEARRRLKAEAIVAEPIEVETLADLLAQPPVDVRYRVDQLWPSDGRVMLAAQAKAGKTHLVANLVKTLVDGGDYLGKFTCHPLSGRVAIIDNEMTKAQLQGWYRSLNITNVQAVDLHYLKGKLSQFNVIDDKTRSKLAAGLREREIEVVVFDCVRPVLDALGLDEHKDAGVFLVAFDALLKEAGVREAVVVHHMGHEGERSRGDSRLIDWPDATWKIVLETPEDKSSTRYFSAYGRDVEIPEDQIWFDSLSHTVQLVGTGGRKQNKTGTLNDRDYKHFRQEVLNILAMFNGPASKRQIEKMVAGDNNKIRSAIKMMIEDGTLKAEAKGNSILVWAV